MKKFKTMVAFGVMLLAVNSITSCKPKLKEVKGVVTEVKSDNIGHDIYWMKVLDGTDTLIMNVEQAKLTNGIMVYGDSIDVYYRTTKTDTMDARVIRVIPKPAKAVDLNSMKNNKLLTR